MIARTKKIQLTLSELNELLSGRSSDGVVNTLPEVFDALNSGVLPVPEMSALSDEELSMICV